jgi:hypothetical protein
VTSRSTLGVVVRVDGPGIFIVLFIIWIVVPAIIGFVLYLIVRLGVKHGLRAHDAAKEGPSPME